MNLNNIYMFKNPIRHFLNINDFEYSIDGNDVIDISNLAWTRSADFVIRRHYDNNDLRLLKLPNILNFYNLYKVSSITENFYKINDISKYSKISVNLTTGDFKAFSYKFDLERDLLKLTEFDVLLRLDIKSFYDSIYTHDLEQKNSIGFSDRFIANCNMGSTKGILMGSYISLFLAEKMLSHIAEKLSNKLDERKIKNSIKYFSDDFYIFTDFDNIDIIKHEFSLVLSEYGLTDNSDKSKVYSYIEYNNINIVDKYWNTILNIQKNHQNKIDETSEYLLKIKKIDKRLKYRLNFLNQLIYRKGKLDDKRSQAILVNGFFKSNFFIDLDVSEYEFTPSDLHNVLYLCREHPEIILYVFPKFKHFSYFQRAVTKYISQLFIKALDKPFQEEQIYYYFGSRCVDQKSYKSEHVIGKVLDSHNQILKAFYVLNGLIDKELDNMLCDEEKNWFLNYHIIVRKSETGEKSIDSLVDKYLLPKGAEKEKQKETYRKFYKKNILDKKVLINEKIVSTIQEYLKNKKDEREQFKGISI